jgi:hypothetical protein
MRSGACLQAGTRNPRHIYVARVEVEVEVMETDAEVPSWWQHEGSRTPPAAAPPAELCTRRIRTQSSPRSARGRCAPRAETNSPAGHVRRQLSCASPCCQRPRCRGLPRKGGQANPDVQAGGRRRGRGKSGGKAGTHERCKKADSTSCPAMNRALTYASVYRLSRYTAAHCSRVSYLPVSRFHAFATDLARNACTTHHPR